MNLRENIDKTQEKLPFITFLMLTDGDWKCGVVQNGSNRFISFYDFAKIPEYSRDKFLSFADQWWWENDTGLPFDSHMRKVLGKSKFRREFVDFHPSLTMIHRKFLANEPIGSIYSIEEKYSKRIKKKRIELLKA